MKPTKITKLDKLDNYGNSTYIIEFASGEKAFYTSKDGDQKKFTVGGDTDCTLEKKIGKNNQEYFKVVIPQKQFAMGGGKPTVDPKISMISMAMSYAKDLVVAGKVPLDEMDFKFNEIYALMLSKL